MTARAWTVADVEALGVTCDVPTAGAILGVGCSTARRLDREHSFPVRVLSLGHARRVVVADLLRLLSADPASTTTDGDDAAVLELVRGSRTG